MHQQKLIDILKNKKNFKKGIYKDSIDSTNAYALRLIRAGFKDNLVIVANEQTHGKGKNDKLFLSPPNEGIYLSLILHCTPAVAQLLFAITAIAIVQALKTYSIPAQIKWPNDILVNRKKVCGILIQSLSLPRNKKFISVIGLGINVHNNQETLFKTANNHITSLKLESHATIHRTDLIAEFLDQFENILNKSADNIIHSYEKHLIRNYHQSIQFKNKTVLGQVQNLTKDGFVLVKTEHGEILKLC